MSTQAKAREMAQALKIANIARKGYGKLFPKINKWDDYKPENKSACLAIVRFLNANGFKWPKKL